MAPHYGMPAGHLPVRSYLAVPVISRSGEVIGGLFFGHPEAEVFTERSERLVVGVAAQAAIAIDNARLYEAAQKQIVVRRRAEEELAERIRLTVLRAEVSSVLAASNSLETVLQNCAELLVDHLDAAVARIWTVDAREEHLELRGSAGAYRHLDGEHQRIKIGQASIGRVAQTRQPHISNNVDQLTEADWAKKEGMMGFASYPLVVDAHLVGVLGVFARHSLTDEVVNEVRLIADGLAQWIQRRYAEQALRLAQEELSRHAENLEKQVAERTALLRETIGELEAFSYSISHDMRAPLRAMQSFALILDDECGAQINANGKEYIRRITSAAERMDRLIQDVLTYSRVARTDLTLESVDVAKLLQDILDSYPMFQSPAADIQVQGEFPLVLAAEAVLTQCISNLLGNAVKFVAPGIVPQVRIWAEVGNDPSMVQLCFRDNGLGIPKEAHENIFGIFQRVSKSFEGTGIGLSIVKKGIERMGGRVGLDSTPGRGSLFWLELRAALR
jgi:signal transduction histidine kinase